MKTIQISDGSFKMLEEMCKSYYVVKGEKPADPNKIVERMINDEWNNYSPPEYQTPGFDRQ